MSFIKKAGVFVLAAISISLILVLSFSFTLNSFLYSQIYFQALEESGVYESLQNGIGSEELFFIYMPNGPKALFEDLFSKLMSYLRLETDILELKVQINEEKLRNFFLDYIGTLQQCSGNQDPFGEEPCLPEGIDVETYLDLYIESKNLNFFDETEVDLVNIYGIEEGSEGRLAIDSLREKISYFKTAHIISFIILIFILSLIFLLQKNTRKFLRTIGVITIVPAFALYIAIYYLSILRSENILPLNDLLTLSIYNAVKEVLSNKLMVCMIILLVVGISSMVLSFVVKQKQIPKKVVTSK
ncbi:hypothetical protein FJZ21_00375 [Candidatus Pacearchaeota archaeon]|nr:hypothetical protein [Candidatus Pacearchaeota archaeon]